MEFYIGFDRALEIISSQEFLLPSEFASLFDSYGRVLRENLIADRDDPPAPVSAMDGYGVKKEDIKSIPAKLKVVGEVPAGKIPNIKVSKGEAVKLFTGSLVPEGVDTVVPVEETEGSGEFVVIKKSYPQGQNVRLRGENYKVGDILVEEGAVLRAPEVGIAASIGKPYLRVSSKPRVGIITTGNEILEPWDDLDSISQIHNTNAYTLYSLVKESGGEPIYLGILKDSKDETAERIHKGIETCDVLITTGGVSMGDYDFVKQVVKELGIEVLFYKVRVKPGKPVLFGKRGSKFFFGLPGFPVSTVVSFNLFVLPLLRKIQGARELFRKRVKAKLLMDFKRRKAERREFVRAELINKDGKFLVKPLRKQGSGVLTSLVGGKVLMMVPEGIREIKFGSEVEVVLI
ncbi:molybdopterin molybdotransferase [Balnearium lithotrophicum]|uniref:Molybdopterin molybdenumtransferase n=1 Tax=Balnearium lithotrophicum TaxID=223788 RepID=A0A521BG77_9BACT|nr:gephyrin-like molybdotransferase Glp [Balnearium lithotrophicum]SMO46093.1 molybdopterin molybdotransferase [Balnearium lithotrophicum]